jgi:hypothetical protein
MAALHGRRDERVTIWKVQVNRGGGYRHRACDRAQRQGLLSSSLISQACPATLRWYAVPSPRRSVVPFPAAASRSLPAVASPAIGFGYQTPTVLSHAVPLGETDVERHESVHAVDGEIGRVEGFVVDPADNRVTHVLLQEGHMWGRKEVAIPVTWRARPLKAQVATLRDTKPRS